MRMASFSPLIWFVTTLVLVRAVIPMGFMPDVSGKHFITICSGAEQISVAVDANNQPLQEQQTDPQHFPDPDGHNGKDWSPCAFASLSLSFLASSAHGDLLSIAPLMSSEEQSALFYAIGLPLHLVAYHPSRAPPTYS